MNLKKTLFADAPVFVTPENAGAYFPNPNTPVSVEDGTQANSTVRTQSDASQNSYHPPNNTPTEQVSDCLDC